MEVTKWLKPLVSRVTNMVSFDFRCGSQPEVSDGHENVGFRG